MFAPTVAPSCTIDQDAEPEQWVDRYGDMLFAYTMRRVRSRSDAEDLVQETFAAALEKRRAFRGECALGTWLVAILHCKIAAQRRTASRGGSPMDDDLEQWLDRQFTPRGKWVRSPSSWGLGDVDAAEHEEFCSTVRACLDRLPAGLASLLVLREQSNLAARELGDAVGASETSVWGRLHRARLAMRECLERRWFNQGEGGP